MQRILRAATHQALLVAALIACSSDDTTGPQPSIQLAVSSATVWVERGSTTEVTATLTRSGGFTGAVALTVEGLPDGVWVTLTPDELTGSSTTSTINFAVSSAATAGSYVVKITASSTIADVETTCLLMIGDPAEIILSAESELTVVRGHSVSTNIQITRTGGFDGGVLLTLAQPLPFGIVGALEPTFTAGPTSKLTLTVTAAVSPGTYLIAIAGASAVGSDEVTIRLTVTTGEPPDFQLVVEPETLTVRPGTSVSGTVTLIPLGGYDKYADLSLVSPPAGISATFEWHYGWIATMTIVAGPHVAPGTYPMTLQGVAEVGTHTTPFTLIVPAPQDFAVAVDPVTLSIEQGSSGSVNVNITRAGGYAGTILLSLVDPPFGIAATFTPPGVSANAALMMVSVLPTVPPRTYTLTVRGTGALVGDRETTLTVTVLSPSPRFVLDAPSDLAVVRGGAVNADVHILRLHGYADAVTLSVAGSLPPGVDAAFEPPVVTGNRSTLTITAGTTVALGRYPITVNATSPTLPMQTATVYLSVATSTGPDFDLRVEPSTLTVKAGGSVTGTVVLTPYGGYNKFADLSFVSPPAGVTATFEWFLSYEADMVISVAPTVAPGTYEMTLLGVAEVGTHTALFTLIVTPAVGVTSTTQPGHICLPPTSARND